MSGVLLSKGSGVPCHSCYLRSKLPGVLCQASYRPCYIVPNVRCLFTQVTWCPMSFVLPTVQVIWCAMSGVLPPKLSGVQSHSCYLPSKVSGVPSNSCYLPSKLSCVSSHSCYLPSNLSGVPSHSCYLPSKLSGVPCQAYYHPYYLVSKVSRLIIQVIWCPISFVLPTVHVTWCSCQALYLPSKLIGVPYPASYRSCYLLSNVSRHVIQVTGCPMSGVLLSKLPSFSCPTYYHPRCLVSHVRRSTYHPRYLLCHVSHATYRPRYLVFIVRRATYHISYLVPQVRRPTVQGT